MLLNLWSVFNKYTSRHFQDPEFDPQKILSKSSAASGLCAWVINIHKFYNVYLIVGPKQKALRDAQHELRAAQEKLDYFNGKIQVCIERMIKRKINKFPFFSITLGTVN